MHRASNVSNSNFYQGLYMMASSALRSPFLGSTTINEVKEDLILSTVTKNVLNMANSADPHLGLR